MATTPPSLPQTCDAKVAIKIGEPQTDCRITHSSFEASFSVAVLRERIKRLISNESGTTWDAESGLYVKATVNARRSDYKRVPEEEGSFYQFFSSIWSYPKRQDHRFYFVFPDDAPVLRPDSETFRQFRYIDAQAQRHQHEFATSVATREMRCIHVRLNGVLVPIDLDIQEVRRALGLPGYDLCPPNRERVVPPTAEPHDLPDIDHAESDDGRDANDEVDVGQDV
ncbi:hypothetical protein GN958_ATG07723 [Phytophthora infestans]|uniref:Uncharacterized protein n=1 Tax=Phytophthora infestans TaxID=4787 RepID=A0A8S9UUZ4_PHYIN|nr:hypothetical protein GN958_ATG22894 [Phytophthora infestans]KAF4143102.1 hypothetical protein GN958_ATG07723 [Phytophthora infestans]